ncbi:MAG: AAA domain-containing protein, partial [Gemmatimonadota bacterium]|nr:AAA domain-containing protein [Gemmatimonadota bacterium]
MSAPDSLEPLWLLLSDCQLAIEEEVAAVTEDLARRRLERPVPALSGRAKGEAGGAHRYAFQIAGGIYDIRAEDRVRIRAGGREATGVVLGFERGLGLVRVLVPEWLGERLDGAELEFDPTWLLRELAARLLEIAEDPETFFPQTVLGLLGRRPPRLGVAEPALATSRDLNEPQLSALRRLLGSDAQLVWGPPGTGKSRLVARAALELAREGRVLVAATTNGAVDEIATRLSSIADPEALSSGRIVRVGSELGSSPELGLERMLARRLEAGAGNVTRTLDEVAARLGRRPPPLAPSRTDPRARAGRLLSLA